MSANRFPVLPLFAGALAVLLGGCMHVAPQPIDLAAHAARRDGTDPAAAIDWSAITARAARLAPDGAPAGAGLDRLTLFAAILSLDPRVAAARDAIATARAEARLAHKAANPALGLTGSYTNDQTQPSPWLIGASAQFQLDFGARREGRITAAELGVTAATYALAEVIWAERGTAARALVDVLAGERQRVLGDELVAAYDRQLAAMERRVAAGAMSSLALAPVRAARAAAARARDDAVARIGAGRAAIATVLGVPVSAIDAMAPVWPDFTNPPASDPVDPARAHAALLRRADVLRAMAAYDQAEANLRVELARQLPTIGLGPGFSWEGGLITAPLGINFQGTAFDFNRAAIRAAVARRAEAGAAVETVLADAAGAITTAARERDAAVAALGRIEREEVPQARIAAERADAALRLGSIDRADWAAAKAADAAARLAAVDALVRVRLAQIALEQALRQPLDGPETKIGARAVEAGQ